MSETHTEEVTFQGSRYCVSFTLSSRVEPMASICDLCSRQGPREVTVYEFRGIVHVASGKPYLGLDFDDIRRVARENHAIRGGINQACARMCENCSPS